MTLEDQTLLQPTINYYDDILLALLNLEENRLWFKEKVEEDDKNLILNFSKWSDKDKRCDKIFQWHIQPIHFDFNRLEHAKYSLATQVLERLKAAINERSYRYPTSDKFNIPELVGIDNEAAFSEDFFQGNLESIEGKCYALYKIYWFKNKFKSSSFDYLIQRWLEPKGKYFAGWEDFHTNKTLLKILMEDCHLPIKAIDEMNIPALSALIRTKIVYGDIKVFQNISSENEDILIFGDVCGNVTSKNGKIKIIGQVATNGCVRNLQGNNEINGDVCGHIENSSGDNKILRTVYKDGVVENSTGSNEIGGDVYGHVENTLLASNTRVFI